MHQIDFGWGSDPDPAGEAYSAPPDHLPGFKGPTSKGRGRKGEGRIRKMERGGRGKGKRGEGEAERDGRPGRREGKGVKKRGGKI